jgi:hypothetical protein
MKTAETVLIVTALAAAAALAFWPRRASAAALGRDVLAPAVGGQAGDMWTPARSAQYREQLAREMAGQEWYGP